MQTNINARHGKEVAGLLSNHKYEITPEGIVLPSMGAIVRGEYHHNVNGLDERVDPNIVVNQGLMYLLSVGFYNGTKYATWYLSLYGNNYTPLAALTAASYVATAGEITSGTEGYTESVRQTWVPSAPASNIIDNVASKAAFTIETASELVVYGAGLHTESAKGAVTGVLASATKFASPRTLQDTDVFNLGYRLTISDVP